MFIKEFVDDNLSFVDEGVYDPHIFKAVFMAGGPGSGKSYVAEKLLGNTGLRQINSDKLYELLATKQDLDLSDPEQIFSPGGQDARNRAKEITKRQQDTFLDGRLGLVIDGTGKDVSKTAKQKEDLQKLGYDCAMIFVNTSLEVALERNKQRPRVLKNEVVEKMWRQVQQNIMAFQQVFGNANFFVVDNSGGLEDPDRQENFRKVSGNIEKFLTKKPSLLPAKNWIKKQLQSRNKT
tara:strand:- start:84 stop:791 length:708 start_codon:yes stop_codon:yes gene_type:complete